MKSWSIGVGAVLGVGAIMFLSNLKADSPSGIDFIRDDRQYAEVNNKVANLAFGIFSVVDADGAITDGDKEKLREAVKYFEAMCVYNPKRIQSYYGAGKCYMILGEKVKAAERFEQAILNKRTDNAESQAGAELTAYECAGLLSAVTLDLASEEVANYNSLSQANDMKGAEAAQKRSKIYYAKALEFANYAVKGVPMSHRYLVDRAYVNLALKNVESAKEDIAKAKVISPDDSRVKVAAKLLGL